MADKLLKDLCKLLEAQGATLIAQTPHIKIQLGDAQVSFSKTPSDRRAYLNIRRDIKRVFGIDTRKLGWPI